MPFQIFRLTSPDGLSFVERLPVLGWHWGTGPAAKVKTPDCLPLQEPLGAQEFLKYLAAILKVEYVADEPVPEEENARAQQVIQQINAAYPATGAGGATRTRQLARASVRYQNGSFTMKGLLQGMVDCTETHFPGMKSMLKGMADQPAWKSDQCNAGVRYTVAPEAQFPALLKMMATSSIGAQESPAWAQAWSAREQQRGAAMVQQIAAQGAAQRAASAAQFNRDQAMRQQMHEQFLDTLQRGTDQSMARAAQVANSNHRMARDWVDYALDQQTVRDPGTGQISKVSSGYNATWIDSSGKASFQTTDPNANPNGAIPGTWTRQQVVHGDGSE